MGHIICTLGLQLHKQWDSELKLALWRCQCGVRPWQICGGHKIIHNEILKVLGREQKMQELSREEGDGWVNRVQGFPATVHHGIIELLAALHKIFVPLFHVTFRDGFCKKRKTPSNYLYTFTMWYLWIQQRPWAVATYIKMLDKTGHCFATQKSNGHKPFVAPDKSQVALKQSTGLQHGTPITMSHYEQFKNKWTKVIL